MKSAGYLAMDDGSQPDKLIPGQAFQRSGHLDEIPAGPLIFKA